MPSNDKEIANTMDVLSSSNLKVKVASQCEMDRNREFFGNLSQSIDLAIKEYSDNLDNYIEDFLKKNKSKNSEKYITGQAEYDSEYDWFDNIVSKIRILFFFLLRKGIIIVMFSVIISLIITYLKNNYMRALKEEYCELELSGDTILEEQESNFDNIWETDVKNEMNIIKVEANSIPIPTSYENVEKEINILQENNSQSFEVDAANGEVYDGKDLLGCKLLIPYIENDKEIYFLGQYDEKYRWDGYCITNIYNSDGTLYGVCEYEFGNGKCLNCKSFYRSETEGEWIYLDRVFYDDKRYGESIRYLFQYDEVKDFTSLDVDFFDIVCADKFVNNVNAIILSYYKGYMSNGAYNDESGDAYFITYFSPEELDIFKIPDDGGLNIGAPVIKTLYKGRFKEGVFYEENYDSWYITRTDKTTYMYFKGGFSDNHPQHKDETKEIFVNYLTHEQIDDYLKEDNLLEYSSQFLTEYENKQD